MLYEVITISGIPFPRPFLRALGLIKEHAARANHDLALLDERRALAIMDAAGELVEGRLDKHFPLDRITSYNVCYTKLLRMSFYINNFFCSWIYCFLRLSYLCFKSSKPS